jgi:hypothetical protein
VTRKKVPGVKKKGPVWRGLSCSMERARLICPRPHPIWYGWREARRGRPALRRSLRGFSPPEKRIVPSGGGKRRVPLRLSPLGRFTPNIFTYKMRSREPLLNARVPVGTLLGTLAGSLSSLLLRPRPCGAPFLSPTDSHGSLFPKAWPVVVMSETKKARRVAGPNLARGDNALAQNNKTPVVSCAYEVLPWSNSNVRAE